MDDVAADYEVLEFAWDTSHGHMVSMLQDRAERGIVIDVGCGSAPHAEVLRDAGFTYVGLDFNPNCVTTLAARGFAARQIDLREIEGLAATLDEAASAGREGGVHSDVVALLSLDVMEHLVDPHLVLHEMSTWMLQRSVPVFGLSVPNVTHRDLSLKLMSARWDLTGSGLLDATHLRFFTDTSLTAIMQRCGFDEIAQRDSSSHWSDQHWPIGSPLLHTVTPVGRFLEDLRDRADAHGATYQFVRLFQPVAVAPTSPTLEVVVPPGDQQFRLAVLADDDMAPTDVAMLTADLDKQTSDRWSLTEVDGVTSGAFSHVAFVGAGQRLGSNWVQQFDDAAPSWPGMLLRCAPDASLTVGSASHAWAGRFDPIEHLRDTATPGVAVAVPVDAVEALGFDLRRGHGRLITGICADLAGFCGVHDTGVAAAAATVDWREGSQPESEVGVGARAPVLVDRAIAEGFAVDRQAALVSEQRCAALAADNALLAADNAWLNGELRVAPIRLLRRMLRRPGRRSAGEQPTRS